MNLLTVVTNMLILQHKEQKMKAFGNMYLRGYKKGYTDCLSVLRKVHVHDEILNVCEDFLVKVSKLETGSRDTLKRG